MTLTKHLFLCSLFVLFLLLGCDRNQQKNPPEQVDHSQPTVVVSQEAMEAKQDIQQEISDQVDLNQPAAVVSQESVGTNQDTAVVTKMEESPASDFETQPIDGGLEIVKYVGNAENVVIPREIDGKPVTSLGNAAFFDCKTLVSIEITDSINNLGPRVFVGCEKLQSIDIPEGVTKINMDTFESCRSLKSVKLPNTLLEIHGAAFRGCRSLTDVTFPDNLKEIHRQAFGGCNLKSVVISKSISSIGEGAFFSNPFLQTIVVDGSNESFSVNDNVLFDKQMTRLLCYPSGKEDKMYEVPATIKIIDDDAFCGSSHLIKVTLPDSVKELRYGTFCDCTSLESVDIPSSVTQIDGWVFKNCSSLKTVNIPNGVSKMGDTVFTGCGKLNSIALPESVTSIEVAAFGNCKELAIVTIPASVTTIVDNAFIGCDFELLVIEGKSGSKAEKFAKEKGIKFVAE